jgi:hypothetical protein
MQRQKVVAVIGMARGSARQSGASPDASSNPASASEKPSPVEGRHELQ